MSQAKPDLQIRIHKLDCTVSTFVQDDMETAKTILEDFDPQAFFSRPKLVLADRNSHTAIPVSQITRIDFDSDDDECALLFPGGIVEAVELGREEFETLLANLAANDQWQHLGEMDAYVVTFLNAQMADGQGVLLTMEVDAESPQGISELRDYLLNRPGLCFRAKNGGVAVLNTANLSSLTFFPGTLQPPADAWPVRHVDTPPTDAQRDRLPVAATPELAASCATRPAKKLTIKRL